MVAIPEWRCPGFPRFRGRKVERPAVNREGADACDRESLGSLAVAFFGIGTTSSQFYVTMRI